MTEQPIALVASAITALVGSAPAGPVGESRLVTSMAHFTRLYGGLWRQSHLGYSVRDYFRHGGRIAVIVRIDPERDVTTAQLAGLALLRDRPEAIPGGDPVALLVVPPGAQASHGWAEPALDVLRETVATAEDINAFAVLDAPAAWASYPDGAADVLESLRSSHAAVYFPQVVEADPLTGEPLTLSPSGAVAGIIARTDTQYGPWNAPAGTATTALDVDGLTVTIPDRRAESLNALRINTIRTLPGTGPVVWGARVLGTDPEWKYIPTRRTAILLEQSIGRGLRWATFEPNTDELWGRVRGRVEELMLMLFRSGAFPGATPQQAFVVRCDRSTMTQADIDGGVLRVLVGFAALRPGEFTMLQVTLAVGLPG